VEQIILIGPPGAGKSSVGKLLAVELGRDFVDTDHLIETKSGKKISDIFLEDGEASFREFERDVVLSSLSEIDGVIALGGGSVLDPAVADELSKKSSVVYLEVSISNAAPRVGFNKERPLLLGNPRQQWLALMESRRAIYESLAKLRVSTDNKKPKEVVAEIMDLL
jgi:shikimate kinase